MSLLIPRPARLVVLASILIDVVIAVDELPARGGDTLGRPVARAPGGGINAASAAARLGLPTVYAAGHGTGSDGDLVRTTLAVEGIGLARPATPGQDTGYCVTLVTPDAERTFVTVAGAEASTTPHDLQAVRYQAGDAVYVSGYDLAYPGTGPALAEHLGRLPAGLLLVLDPGPLVDQIPVERWNRVLARVEVLSLNAREHALLTTDPSRQLGASTVVVRRDGPAGAQLLAPGHPPLVAPGYPVLARDTTGAGDVHVGAMLAGLAEGRDWAGALDLANRAAAVSVTRTGGATGPTLAELAGAELIQPSTAPGPVG